MISRRAFPTALGKFGIRSFKNDAGFTLVEIIVVMGLTTLILGIGTFFAFDNFQRYLFRKERDTAVVALMRARSRAMNNFAETPYGLHIDSDQFVLFRAAAYDSGAATNEMIPGSSIISKTGDTDIIFTQLSGNPVSGEKSITLSGGMSNVTIVINNEGRIDW